MKSAAFCATTTAGFGGSSFNQLRTRISLITEMFVKINNETRNESGNTSVFRLGNARKLAERVAIFRDDESGFAV